MENIKKAPICEICGGGGKIVHHGTRDKSLIDVYKCEQCETKFLVSPEKMNNDYENGFMHLQSELSKVSIEERLREFELDDNRRFDMVKEMCKGKKVLDFGCGFGGFVHKINTVADNIKGIELGREEREYLNTKGYDVKKTIDEIKEKVDVITLFHVFEHLSNPREWLIKFAEYLLPGGMLVIEVPNANDALLTLYANDKFADFTYWSAHLFLYTSESLEKLVNSVGIYEIVESTQIQRYPISNHLYWLAKGAPGGHKKWKQIESDELDDAYERKLKELKMCDTIFVILKLKG